MRKVLIFSFYLIFNGISAQTVTELENRMAAENDKSKKAKLCIQIAEKYLGSNANKSTEFANRAAGFASEANDKALEAEARFVHGEGYWRLKDFNAAATRYKMGVAAGKSAGAAGLEPTLDCLNKLGEIAIRNRDYKGAYDFSQQTVELLQKGSPGGSARELEKKYAGLRERLEQEKLRLDAEKKQLMSDIATLSAERDQLRTGFSQKTEELKKTKTETEKIISTKEEQLANLTEEKKSLDELSTSHEKMIAELTKEQIADSLMLSKQIAEKKQLELAVANGKLIQRQSEYLRNILLLLSGFVILLAGLFYARYRAKKKSSEVLEQKNKLIETERERSDNLLLNILPPAIAAELRTEGRAAARRYDQATVMFVDLIGFTRTAETLTPAEAMALLRAFHTLALRIVFAHGGMVDKFMGDGVMACFGVPEPTPSAAADALRMAFALLAALEQPLPTGAGPPRRLRAAIGIHAGPVLMGDVGGDRQLQFTVVGDAVNVASRLETLTRSQGTCLIASDAVVAAARAGLEAELLGRLEPLPPATLRGRAEPVAIWRLVDPSGTVAPLSAGA